MATERGLGAAKTVRIEVLLSSNHGGYNNSSTPTNEYNVKMCPKCMRELFQSGMNVTITPLDTCGVFELSNTSIRTVFAASNPLSVAMAVSWAFWCTYYPCTPLAVSDYLVVYDVVGTFLAHPDPQTLLNIQPLKIWVTDEGYTVVDDAKGTPMDVAVTWKANGIQWLEALFTAAVTKPAV